MSAAPEMTSSSYQEIPPRAAEGEVDLVLEAGPAGDQADDLPLARDPSIAASRAFDLFGLDVYGQVDFRSDRPNGARRARRAVVRRRVPNEIPEPQHRCSHRGLRR